MTTAERLTHLRIQAELSQEKLSRSIPYSRRTIGAWERGEKQPSLASIVILSKFYGVTSDYILCLTDEK